MRLIHLRECVWLTGVRARVLVRYRCTTCGKADASALPSDERSTCSCTNVRNVGQVLTKSNLHGLMVEYLSNDSLIDIAENLSLHLAAAKFMLALCRFRPLFDFLDRNNGKSSVSLRKVSALN